MEKKSVIGTDACVFKFKIPENCDMLYDDLLMLDDAVQIPEQHNDCSGLIVTMNELLV